MSVNDKMQLKTGANILLAKVHINLSPTYILSKKEIDYFIKSITETFLRYKDN